MFGNGKLVVEAADLLTRLGDRRLLIVDLSKPENYLAGHVPGACHLDYPLLLSPQPPAMGLPAPPERLAGVLGQLGYTGTSSVVAYDDEGGGRAARLLWTLDLIGHRQHGLLDGGLAAWASAGGAIEREPATASPTRPALQLRDEPLARADDIVRRLGSADFRLLDARSPEEFAGIKRFAERGGHIPGAVNIEWTRFMDPERQHRLRPLEQIRRMLLDRDLRPDHEIVTYCHTHHRSAFTYWVLRVAGYTRVRGYAGSWSEWGNAARLPVED